MGFNKDLCGASRTPLQRDPVTDRRHRRINIIVKRSPMDGDFVCRDPIVSHSRIKLFRPDLACCDKRDWRSPVCSEHRLGVEMNTSVVGPLSHCHGVDGRRLAAIRRVLAVGYTKLPRRVQRCDSSGKHHSKRSGLRSNPISFLEGTIR